MSTLNYVKVIHQFIESHIFLLIFSSTGKKLWDVTYEYNAEYDLIYLKAKKHKNSISEIYVPWPETQNITPAFIDDVLLKLRTNR